MYVRQPTSHNDTGLIFITDLTVTLLNVGQTPTQKVTEVLQLQQCKQGRSTSEQGGTRAPQIHLLPPPPDSKASWKTFQAI